MLPSQLGAGIDKLVALFTTAVDPVPVYDGPSVSSDWSGKWVVVGGDGPVEEEEDAGRVVQSWVGLGALTRSEELTIPCALGCSTGASQTSMKARRDDALAMLADLEAALRADPGLDGFTTGGAAAVSEMAMKYVTNSRGIAVVLTFNIDIPVRI